MLFHVVDRGAKYQPLPGHCYLHVDYWDDWGKYRIQFPLSVVNQSGMELHIGAVKFGESGLKPGTPGPNQRTPALPLVFERLDKQFFSVGQDETYYEALNLLSPEIRVAILIALRDCAYDLTIFNEYIEEDVMSESLLREVSATQVRHRFSRLAHGDAILTAFQFSYTLPVAISAKGVSSPAPTLSFAVTPFSTPPTNVHVLIGRNGVGKTRCM